MSSIKHILFSVAGMSPAIITETLFGLRSQGVVGGEIHLLTTSFGKKKMQVLLGDAGQVAAFNRMYNSSWVIREDWIETLVDNRQQPLQDLRSSVDNETAANAIVERVRFWTGQDDVVLHASVAGGRKTMGIYLTQAMSWFARPDDDLSHVLVVEEFESNKDFYFPLVNESSHVGVVDFAQVPFVRMRNLLPEVLMKEQSFSQRVKLSEVYLRDISNQDGSLYFDLEECLLFLDGFKLVKLQPLNAGLYLFLLENANVAQGQEPFYFADVFDYREILNESFNRVHLNVSQKGLSGLALSDELRPQYWRNLGGDSESELRKKDLEGAFGKLNQDFKPVWKNASFRVFNKTSRSRGPCRWVEVKHYKIERK